MLTGAEIAEIGVCSITDVTGHTGSVRHHLSLKKYALVCLVGITDIAKDVDGKCVRVRFTRFSVNYMNVTICSSQYILVLLHNVMMSFEKPDLVVDSLTALYPFIPCHLFVLDVNAHSKVQSLY